MGISKTLLLTCASLACALGATQSFATAPTKPEQYILSQEQAGKYLSPEQQRAIVDYQRKMAMAKSASPNYIPKRQVISYSSDNPPVIYVAKDRISTITFVDGAGNPFAIQSFFSSSKAFTVDGRWQKQNTYSSGNTLLTKPHKKVSLPAGFRNSLIIQSSNYTDGDLVVYLQGISNPIHIMLNHATSYFDYQSTIAMGELTPESAQEVSASGEHFAMPSHMVMGLLNGTPPKGAVAYEISDASSQVWRIGKSIYLRSRSELQSPAFISTESIGAYHLYQLPLNTHYVSLVDHAQMHSAQIQPPRSINEQES